MIDDILLVNYRDVAPRYRADHEGYEYSKREIVPLTERKQCTVSYYEIPPKKAAYPYHYHLQNEEVFYIIKGTGTLKTPGQQRSVSEGDFIFFPANFKGAHKLTNDSDVQTLVYIDFDTNNPLDVAFYPDSEKVGIFSKDVRQLFFTKDQVGYYDGE